ncbi:MAG: tetratricopeptide repeat protein [Salinivirgaceae bacterium]|nr:tetratricopeptide repeat protein [Salinivirgaceae bacterium]MDD4747044.1 tetratricopeptide repeat protein [Salinivirgaceae bacterium]MDY0280326.1 tetratricopeptide repeat protein [Salinivirgaceae bacterium]
MKNRLWILICSFLFINILTIHGNELPQEIRELESQLTYVPNDSAKVDLLIDLALQYRKYNTQKVFEYATKAFNLSSKIGYEKGIAASNNRLGSFYRQTGIYDKAIDYYFRALKYYEKVNDKRGISFCSNGIGNILRIQQFYDRAIEYQQRALDISIEQKDSVGMSIYYRNLGSTYDELGDYERALVLNQKSLDILGYAGNTSVRIANFQAVGTSYFKLGDLPKSIYYYNKALKLGEETSNFYSMTYTLNRLANCYVCQHDLAKGEDYYKRSIEMAKELGVKYDIKDAYVGLSNLYGEKGKYEMAYKNLRFYTDYYDSIFTIENAQNISKLEQIYDMEQQQIKIELLTKTNELNEINIIKQRNISYSLIAFALLFVGFVIILIRYNKRVQKTNLMLKQKNEEIKKRNTEIEIQAQELRKLSIVAGKTIHAIMIIKPNGEIDWVNDAFTRIYGYTLETFIEERGKYLIWIDSDPEIRHKIERCIQHHESVTYSLQVPCSDKSEMWIQTTLSPIFNNDGSIQCFVAIDTDITSFKKSEIDLIQMKDKLVSSAIELELKNIQISKQRDDLSQLNTELNQKNEEIQRQENNLLMMNIEES